MKKFNTLEDWLKAMIETTPNKLISLRTHKNLDIILDGESKKNFVVFDNAGGCQFCIWEFDTKEEAEKMIASFKKYLVFGWVFDGISELSPYQKSDGGLHWDLQSKREPPKINEFFRG